jgi:hypothetical protein
MSGSSVRTSIVRRWILRLLLVSISVGVTLVLTEIAFRFMNRYRPRPRAYVGEFQNVESKNFAVDPRLGWKMRPNHRFTEKEGDDDILYAADQDGFRTDPTRAATGEGKRLVAVGDSFTWGAGVPAAGSFPAIVAERLGGWNLTNMSQPGYGLDQIWQTVVHEAIPRSPDLIIAGIYPEDLGRSLTAYRAYEKLNKPMFGVQSGRLVPLTADDRPNPVTRYIDAHSRVYELWRRTSAMLGFRYGIGAMWSLNEAILDEMIRVGAEAHVPIVFVHVPTRTLDPFPALAAYMKKKGALFVDPVEALKGEKDLPYFALNQHLNATGHRIVAAEIEKHVRSHPELLRRW